MEVAAGSRMPRKGTAVPATAVQTISSPSSSSMQAPSASVTVRAPSTVAVITSSTPSSAVPIAVWVSITRSSPEACSRADRAERRCVASTRFAPYPMRRLTIVHSTTEHHAAGG
jgi:hypothetical protein